MYVCVLSHVQLSVIPQTVACQATLSRQEYWSGLPFPPAGDLPDLGIEPASPMSPASQGDSLPAELLGPSWPLDVVVSYFYLQMKVQQS